MNYRAASEFCDSCYEVSNLISFHDALVFKGSSVGLHAVVQYQSNHRSDVCVKLGDFLNYTFVSTLFPKVQALTVVSKSDPTCPTTRIKSGVAARRKAFRIEPTRTTGSCFWRILQHIFL